MSNTIFFVILLFGVCIRLIKFNKEATKSRKIVSSIIVFIAMLFIYNTIIGPEIKLNGSDAAQSNSFVEDDSEWLGMIELKGNEFHMFYEPLTDKYRTVFVENLLVGYKSTSSTTIFPHNDDRIRTIGVMNVSDDSGEYSAFMVLSEDDNVRSIALIDEYANVLSSENIVMDGPTLLAHEYEGRNNSSNCELVALDASGDILYYYGYQHGDTNLNEEEYKWYTY